MVISFPVDIFPEVGLLDHMVGLFLIFKNFLIFKKDFIYFLVQAGGASVGRNRLPTEQGAQFGA